ncbi:MAG TPA: O-antigen ligase family protein [Chloroflexia bacterium]|nr:O-antigen ligase family protein [Chloroflexia bacterium]
MTSTIRPPTTLPLRGPAAALPAESSSAAARISERVLLAALLLVLAMSPFEAGYPPFGRFLMATFTNLEVTLFVLGGAWLLRAVTEPRAILRLRRVPLLLPIAALIGASVLSTLFGEYRSLGVQFTYRLLMGAMVYVSVWEVLRTRGRLFVALSTFAGAGLVSAVFGLLEFVPALNIQPWLRMFKPQPTTVGGMLRLSGTFEYANGAAAYFEMALPVLIGLVLLISSRTWVDAMFGRWRVSEGLRRAVLVVLVVAVGIYGMALVLTMSRAALVALAVGVLVIVAAMVLRSRRADRTISLPSAWRPLALVALVMLAAGAVVFLTQPMFRLRLVTQNDRDWYRASLTAPPLPSLQAGQWITVPVTVRNDGRMTWEASGVLPIHVSYHWMSAEDDVYLLFDGARTPLPRDVAPGETVTVNAIVQTPTQAGNYRLQWDLVHENVTWFDRKEGMAAEIRPYTVAPATASASGEGAATGSLPLPTPQLSVEAVSDGASVERLKLWRAAWAMFLDHPLVGVGPDGFRNMYGEYAGVNEWNRNIYTNNMYIEMLANLGLVGGLAFLGLVLLALRRIAANVLRAPAGPVWLLGLGASAACTAFFAHGFVDYFLFATPIYVLFWFLLGVAVHWPSAAGTGAARPESPAREVRLT